MLRFTTHRSLARLRALLGFTQIEILVIIFIIGVMAAITVPGFGDMLEAAKMKQATAELRSAFQESQRQSIRKNQTCDTSVLIPASPSQSTRVSGSCLSSSGQDLPKGIGITTNIVSETISDRGHNTTLGTRIPLPPVHRAGLGEQINCHLFPSQCKEQDNNDDSRDPLPKKVTVGFGHLGAAHFDVVTPSGASNSGEHSAKFVSYRPKKLEKQKSCIVLSRSLGLTRIGTYQGTLTPTEITTQGRCQVASWSEQ